MVVWSFTFSWLRIFSGTFCKFEPNSKIPPNELKNIEKAAGKMNATEGWCTVQVIFTGKYLDIILLT